MQFKQEMYQIQNTFTEIDFNSRDRVQILAHREEFIRLASPYIANSQIGLLVSFVASYIGKQMLLENADELPELIQAKVLHPKTVLSVANSEANGGTDLREMRSCCSLRYRCMASTSGLACACLIACRSSAGLPRIVASI